MILSGSSLMADAIFSDLSLIPVVNRLGVSLGVGDFSIDEICRRHKIDSAFFLAVVNTFLNDNYFPGEAEVAFPIEMVLDYLSLTDEYYAGVQLPNIARHFNSLLGRSPADNNLPQLSRFFEETSHELLDSISADKESLFPMICRMRGGERLSEEKVESLKDSLSRKGIAEKVADLASFFVMHLKGEYDRNLCFAVLSAVSQLARDIRQNNRIRERILSPLVEKLIVRSPDSSL